MGKTPLVLLTYNRPKHVEQAIRAISRCSRLDECLICVYCDGPQTHTHESGVRASRRVVRRWVPHLGARVLEHSENIGLARSVVCAVTELCAEHGRVIVLEDDFVVSPDFLTYMLDALDRYEGDERVLQVSGHMFPIADPPSQDAFFLPLSTTRGWATWQRAWRSFDWHPEDAVHLLATEDIRQRFDIGDNYSYSQMLRDRLAGKNQSWGILWWWSVFRSGGLVLYPRHSLVWVGGFDGSGTHSISSPEFRQPPKGAFLRERLSTPLLLPNNIIANTAAFEQVKAFIGSWAKPKPKRGRDASINSVRAAARHLLENAGRVLGRHE